MPKLCVHRRMWQLLQARQSCVILQKRNRNISRSLVFLVFKLESEGILVRIHTLIHSSGYSWIRRQGTGHRTKRCPLALF